VVAAHFRSEAARLADPTASVEDCLVLRGRIVQSSYPGGLWRYTVRVGADQFLVDDRRRLAIGEAVAVALPAEALHVYAVAPNN
jgi:hypothetical protein